MERSEKRDILWSASQVSTKAVFRLTILTMPLNGFTEGIMNSLAYLNQRMTVSQLWDLQVQTTSRRNKVYLWSLFFGGHASNYLPIFFSIFWLFTVMFDDWIFYIPCVAFRHHAKRRDWGARLKLSNLYDSLAWCRWFPRWHQLEVEKYKRHQAWWKPSRARRKALKTFPNLT